MFNSALRSWMYGVSDTQLFKGLECSFAGGTVVSYTLFVCASGTCGISLEKLFMMLALFASCEVRTVNRKY